MQNLKKNYDVIVIGGGINGVGIARDLALRGISCLLVEKNDYAAGTSGASSGMIHGGPRYMLSDIDVTKLACLDSGYIQKVAPHLLFRIPFLYPIYQKSNQPKWQSHLLLEASEAFFAAYDQFVPLKNGKPHTRLSAEDAVALEPNLPSQNLLGAITFDEWGIDVPRLCVANVQDAIKHGATALNHTEVANVHCENKTFHSVDIKNTLTQAQQTVSGKFLVNATGPWSQQFTKKMGLTVKLRPGKGIHLVYDRRLINMAIVTQAIDGREIFIMPYENTTIIATTDDDFFGDLDQQLCTEDEIKYLQEAIEKVFPQIRQSRLIATYSGVRPTLYARENYESHLSREHDIIDHALVDNRKNIFSLTGGKLASYRIIAEELVDLLAERLGNITPCLTAQNPLPGGQSQPDVSALAKEYQIDPYAVSRLVYRHGQNATTILATTQNDPSLKSFICTCEPVMACEFVYVIEHEQAQTLSDVRRRTRWTQGSCQGTDCLLAGVALFEKCTGNTDYTTANHITDFANEWWFNRASILSGTQLKQEELQQALNYCNNSLHRA